MTQDTLQLLKHPVRERLPDQIAGHIKALILSKKIELGEKLPTERELASTLGVSRVVVREAIRILEQAGLVETRLGASGGSYVSSKLYKPFLGSIYDLLQDGELTLRNFFEAREAVECFTILVAAENVKAKDLKRLRQINQMLLEDVEDGEELHFYNMAFHIKIAEMSGNPLLKLMVGALLNLLKVIYPIPCQSEDFARATHERHFGIIEAMKKRDMPLCEKLMREDVGHTEKLARIPRANS
jgi:GntR family transcriptional repressor for pyruvate dehydrogenase complex